MNIEDEARKEYNALPLEERKKIAFFRNLERIAELMRQRSIEKDRHESAMSKISQTIERTRQAMLEEREMHA